MLILSTDDIVGDFESWFRIFYQGRRILMSHSLITKRALAQGIQELMKIKSLSQITVQDICDTCDLSRKAFYYHFKDKYDLVNWIYQLEFFAQFSLDAESENYWERMQKALNYFYENKQFYKNALELTGQNSFYEYFVETIAPIMENHFSQIFSDNQSDDEEQQFCITFFSTAIRNVLVDWLQKGAIIPPEKLTRLIRSAVIDMARYIMEDEKPPSEEKS
ncbi:MAG: Transcriptional regulator, TetRNA family [Bacillota bacterium]|jgi:probable dihydroxyacetone kinase regulator|nr:Transcriptional regulator, TetRNA family [Bacillota bacterium]